ncbi:MAG: biopolymer transporter ExbD [Candidatus Marinimicrobia bacterium]|nr:biopolymer transporter ExbD [Candidatus Neomarinimicrobiota bacterium]
MKLKRKSERKTDIPTASLPDIIFMLIFFFMVSSVLKKSEGLPITLPEAKQIQKLESRVHVAQVWISKSGMISIDGKIVEPASIRNIMYKKRVADPQLTVSVRADRQTPMEVIDKVHKELRKADALKVNYSSRTAT